MILNHEGVEMSLKVDSIQGNFLK